MKAKAQSALEYMMTYGWAILIIVIVAAVLFSLGIFSPSSSVGPTATGFAPFVTLSQSCGPSGLVVQLGNDAGAPVTVDFANVTTSTGITGLHSNGNETSLAPTTGVAISGGSVTLNWGTHGDCATAGARYSASVTVTYTTTSGTFVTPGTVTGTAST